MAKTETTEQLMEKLNAMRIQNEQEGLKEIEAILKKRNLTLTTNVAVTLNGQPVGIIVKAL